MWSPLVAALIVASTATPAVAARPRPKRTPALSKAQVSAVLSLIKRYSKPGPVGRTGATGAPATPSQAGFGLSLTGNAFSLDEGALGGCPAYEFVTGFFGQGAPRCDVAPVAWAAGEFTTQSIPQATPVTVAATQVVPTGLSYAVSATATMFNTNGGVSPDVNCTLDAIAGATRTTLAKTSVTLPINNSSEDVALSGYDANAPAGTEFALDCTATATGVYSNLAFGSTPNGGTVTAIALSAGSSLH